MVRKKVLQAQIELLTDKVNDLMSRNDNLNAEIESLTKKIEFIYQKAELLDEQPEVNWLDEWMNGAKKEGEN